MGRSLTKSKRKIRHGEFPAGRENRGSFLAFALIIGLVVAVLAVSIVSIGRHRSIQSNYLANMDRAYRLAESGLNAAISALIKNPDPLQFNTAPVPCPDEDGEFENWVELSDKPLDPIYYIITSATRTIAGRNFATKLHSYIRVANVASYFISVSDDLTISHPVNISSGAVYARRLTFEWDDDPDTLTILGSASFYDTCNLKKGGVLTQAWTPNVKADIEFLDPGMDEPIKLAAPLFFPQVLDEELIRLKALAGPHTAATTFTGQIYPPGYAEYGATSVNEAGDAYPSHTADNQHHIYYADGDMHISGEIHGQILFVSGGNIHITSGVVSSLDAWRPGAGLPSSSTAHQAVLIPKGNVYIDHDYFDQTPPLQPQTQRIQAMIFAPHSYLIPERYSDANVHNLLSLEFKGSMVLKSMNFSPNLPTVFRAGRTYEYMTSLKENPPPYLPYNSEIYFSLEETR